MPQPHLLHHQHLQHHHSHNFRLHRRLHHPAGAALQRQAGERFIDAARRLGPLPFRSAADAVRKSTARTADTASTDA